MKEIELGEVQAVFADIIWANEPVTKQTGWLKCQ